MYVFDVLAHNPGRAPEEMRYGPADGQLALTGQSRAVRPRTDTPKYLRAAPLRLSPFLRAQLQALTAERLASALGDVLDAGAAPSVARAPRPAARVASD